MRKTLRDDDWENGHKFETLLRFDQVSSSHSLEPCQNNSHPLLTQLKKAIQSKRAFEGFQEAPINYMPYVSFSLTFSFNSQSCHNPFRTYRFGTNLSMDSMGYDLKSIQSLCKSSNFISVMFFLRRKPGWTDRILYMHGATCQVHQLSYTSHPQIIMSDHRPVSADFTVDVSLEGTYLERRLGLLTCFTG